MPPAVDDLVGRFVSSLPPATTPVAAHATGSDLLRRWSQPHRRYHTVAHLRSVLSVIDGNADQATDPDQVRLAAWYHDAIYDPSRLDNERRSADLAGAQLGDLGVPAATIAEVIRLVELTAGHGAAPGDRNGALLCDSDLAVLATPPAAYQAYRAAIRAEYAHLPDDVFASGRAQVLAGLLALDRLYRLPRNAAAWEAAARANLHAELDELTSLG